MENILNHLLTSKYSFIKLKISQKIMRIIIKLKKIVLLLLIYNLIKPFKNLLLYFINIIKML